jgi:hypothetical protein
MLVFTCDNLVNLDIHEYIFQECYKRWLEQFFAHSVASLSTEIQFIYSGISRIHLKYFWVILKKILNTAFLFHHVHKKQISTITTTQFADDQITTAKTADELQSAVNNLQITTSQFDMSLLL